MPPTKVEAPDFHMIDSLDYRLERAHLGTARLNLQYLLWQRILGFTIPRSVAIPFRPLIADIACGTALWALDVAQKIPSVEIHCTDVDLTQAPARAWLPENITLKEWDIFEDPPKEMVGIYDLVHVRLLVLVLSGKNPLPVIKRLKSLLKPGGWIQWEDIDTTQMHVKYADKDVEAPALEAILEMSKSGGRHDWVAKLPEILESEGFDKTSIESYSDPVELSRALNDLHLMTFEEFASNLLKVNKKEAASKVLAMVKKGYEESTKGAAISYPRVACTARNSIQ